MATSNQRKRTGKASAVATPARRRRRSGEKPTRFAGRAVQCSNCTVFGICVPAMLSGMPASALDALVERRRLVERGEPVFRRGEPTETLYAVKSGAVKTVTGGAARDRAVDFHLPGDLIGLEGLGEVAHRFEAKALQTTSLCEIPIGRLEQIGRASPVLLQKLMHLIGANLRDQIRLRLLHNQKSAAVRVAAYLVHMSRRQLERGFSSREFRLPMSRADLGSFLGLTKETVCRELVAMQERGLVAIDGKRIRLLDAAGLAQIAAPATGDAVS